MFLHIISILLHKKHPYFSQYAAYLRNMHIIKIVSTIDHWKFKTKTLWYKYCSMQCSHQSTVRQFIMWSIFGIFLYERYMDNLYVLLLIYWRPELRQIFIFAFSDNMKHNTSNTQSQKSILDFFSSKPVHPTQT